MFSLRSCCSSKTCQCGGVHILCTTSTRNLCCDEKWV